MRLFSNFDQKCQNSFFSTWEGLSLKWSQEENPWITLTEYQPSLLSCSITVHILWFCGCKNNIYPLIKITPVLAEAMGTVDSVGVWHFVSISLWPLGREGNSNRQRDECVFNCLGNWRIQMLAPQGLRVSCYWQKGKIQLTCPYRHLILYFVLVVLHLSCSTVSLTCLSFLLLFLFHKHSWSRKKCTVNVQRAKWKMRHTFSGSKTWLFEI